MCATNLSLSTLKVDLEKCDETWDPKGASEDNTTTIRAFVTPVTAKGKFRFTLYDVSDEKGYCLNAPIAIPSSGEDSDAWKDLQFTDNQTGITVSGVNKDAAETTANNLSEATVTIKSFDYGSYGKIKVEFVLQDGSVVLMGTEKDGVNKYTSLPRDADGNHIRDGAIQNSGPGTSHAQEDDNETLPIGKGIVGDKLSRYEEYRGFMVAGDHFRTDTSKKTVLIANGTEESFSIVRFGVEQLGYDIRAISPADMTANQVINGNRETPAGAVEMFAILLQVADLSLKKQIGSCLGRIDTKALCKFDFSAAESQSGGDAAVLKKIKQYMFGHEIGHALYLLPPSADGLTFDGHEYYNLKDCFMDYRVPGDDTPPTTYCATPGTDGYNCSVKHSVKGQ